jgi:hypothetical protein
VGSWTGSWVVHWRWWVFYIAGIKESVALFWREVADRVYLKFGSTEKVKSLVEALLLFSVFLTCVGF